MKRNIALHCLAIKAYSNMNKFAEAENIIDFFPENTNENEILSAKIHCYGRSGDMDKAWNAYNAIDEYKKDIVMVNNMMYALHYNGFDEECINIFKQLLSPTDLDHLSPNVTSFTNALMACASANMLEFGINIHQILKAKKQWVMKDNSIQANLINLYNKCGKLDLCKQCFFEFGKDKHLNVWNAMLKAYGDHGQIKQIKALYPYLEERKPDKNTFAILINAYAQNGEIDEAMHVWKNEISDDVIKSDSGNLIISSFVNALSKNGMLDKAQQLMLDFEKKSGNFPKIF